MSDIVVKPNELGTPKVTIKVNVTGGTDGATFTPAVSEDGVLSWSNNGGLENPAPVDVKGPKGDAGGASGWNDLKDKPFGEVEKAGYVYPETTVTLSEGEGNLTETPVAPIVNGRSYDVNWNGTDYTCTAVKMEFDGIVGYILGNMAALGGDDTGEPFVLVLMNEVPEGAGQIVADLTGATSATFSVYGVGEFTETLAEKYLSDNVKTLKVTILHEVVGDTYSADKSVAEIIAATKKGYTIQGVLFQSLNGETIGSSMKSLFYNGYSSDEGFVSFTYNDFDGRESAILAARYTIYASGDIVFTNGSATTKDQIQLNIYVKIANDGAYELSESSADTYYDAVQAWQNGRNVVLYYSTNGGYDVGSLIGCSLANSMLYFIHYAPPSDDDTNVTLKFITMNSSNQFKVYTATLPVTVV